MAINVGAVFSVVELAKKMKNLKALIHVSTAYCNTHLAWWEMIRKSFFKLRPFPHNYLKTLSVPEEIVDNSDLGDPEGMLQLSRVTYHYHLKSILSTCYIFSVSGWELMSSILTLHPIDQSIYLCRRWIQTCSIPWRASWLATDQTLTLTQRCIKQSQQNSVFKHSSNKQLLGLWWSFFSRLLARQPSLMLLVISQWRLCVLVLYWLPGGSPCNTICFSQLFFTHMYMISLSYHLLHPPKRPGWTERWNGPSMSIVGLGTGVMRTSWTRWRWKGSHLELCRTQNLKKISSAQVWSQPRFHPSGCAD